MTTPPLPGGPLATIREIVERTFEDIDGEWGCGHEWSERTAHCKGIDDASAILTSLDLLSELVRAAQNAVYWCDSIGQDTVLVHEAPGVVEMDLTLEYVIGAKLRRALLPFETSTEEE